MQVLYYNVFVVPKLIENKRSEVEQYLSPNFSEELFRNYRKFGMDAYNVVFDRTGNLPHYINIKSNLHPIPAFDPTFNKSFEEVVKQRALEILATGKKINVVWSGGLDSTLALFALMHYANDLSQIKVIGTYGSVIESGSLFDKRIKDKIAYDIKINTKTKITYTEDDIFVTGFMGNQLFGPTNEFSASGKEKSVMFHHSFGSPEVMYEPYEKHVNPELLEFIKPAIDASPRKIETICDLRWYCIFNFDWYTSHYDMASKVDYTKLYHFYDSLDFQKYAITTKDPWTKDPSDSLTHRWVMRDLIAEYSGDRDYAYKKKKGISAFSIPDPNSLFLLEDYSLVVSKSNHNI